MSAIPSEFPGVTAVAKANVYFDGKVVSHAILFPKAERMEIVAGSCVVKLDGAETKTSHSAGQHFDVPANSGFDIQVSEGICEYICSFLD
jgi:uncharacterized protein YaiE (UPF0345 family)